MTTLPKPPKKSWYQRAWVWCLLVLVLCLSVGGAIAFFSQSAVTTTDTSQVVTAEVRDLAQVVSTTGKIAAEHSELLSLPLGGKVSEVNVQIGDVVAKDKVLVKASGGQQIKAPFDGRILAVNTFVGNNATPGVPVVEIGYRTNFVDFIASESEVFDLAPGQAVSLTIPTYDNSATTYHGTVELVDTKKTITTTENGYVVRLRPSDLPDAIGNFIGLTVNVKVVVDEKSDVLSIERAAVQYNDADQAFVQVPNTDPALPPLEQLVTTDFEGDDYIEITSGLAAGDSVVLNIPKSSSLSVF